MQIAELSQFIVTKLLSDILTKIEEEVSEQSDKYYDYEDLVVSICAIYGT